MFDVRYEVVVYSDDTRQDGQVAAFTDSQEQAAQLADELRASGYTGVLIKRLGPPEQEAQVSPAGE